MTNQVQLIAFGGTLLMKHVESVTMSTYAPAVHLVQQRLVEPGGTTTPEKLLRKALGEGKE